MKSINRIKDEYETMDGRIGYLKSLGIKEGMASPLDFIQLSLYAKIR